MILSRPHRVAAELPRAIETISALKTQRSPSASEQLRFIHLNGSIDDLPDVTFSEPQYGTRLAGLEPLYQQLVLDLTAAPVVFVGTRLMEPPLWRHIALRDAQGAANSSGYARSYLVAPELAPARRELLNQYNIIWIPATAAEFSRGTLAPLSRECERGHARLKSNVRRDDRYQPISSVTELLTALEEEDAGSEYLLGAEPRWSDIRAGRIVPREFERTVDLTLRNAALLVHGTAGAGTSSTLMRMAATASAAGSDTVWIDARDVGDARHLIRSLQLRQGDCAIFVDNADALGHNGRRLLDGLRLAGKKLLVVLGLRSYLRGRRSTPDPAQFPRGYLTEIEVPRLELGDIERLIAALDKDGKLGRLTAMTHAQRVSEFEAKANRQLLVAMIEVTSGLPHRKKAVDEHQSLPGAARNLYAVAAVARFYVKGDPLFADFREVIDRPPGCAVGRESGVLLVVRRCCRASDRRRRRRSGVRRGPPGVE